MEEDESLSAAGAKDHIYTPRTRFIPDELLPLFERTSPASASVDIAAKLREMWS